MLDQASNAPPGESRYHVLPWEDADLYASAPTSPHGMRTLLDTLERMPGDSLVPLSCAHPCASNSHEQRFHLTNLSRLQD